jgi:predicted FMN-binding regulatory protein PaiB
MNSTTDPKAIEPDDVLVARADERLVHAYDQIARADEQMARLTEQLSKLEHDAARHPSTVVSHRPSRGRPALRGFIGLLLAVCIFVGAFVSQSSYGDVVARWAPKPSLTSSLPMAKPGLPAQLSPSTVQVAAADSALSQLPPPAQPAPQDAAAAPIPPELTQLLQTMARDLANVQQGIEQLKTSQEELARENARTAEQLKASQEQMARAIANASEQNLRRRTSATPPPPIATPARRPVSALPPTEARAQARAPVPLRPGQQ